MYESRHKLAQRRKRLPNGRFATAKDKQEMIKKEEKFEEKVIIKKVKREDKFKDVNKIVMK